MPSFWLVFYTFEQCNFSTSINIANFLLYKTHFVL